MRGENLAAQVRAQWKRMENDEKQGIKLLEFALLERRVLRRRVTSGQERNDKDRRPVI